MDDLTLENFFKEIDDKFNENDRQIIERAFIFAKKAHEGQKRASGEPYFVHAYKTGATLMKWGLDAETIAAGLLHDVAEDTATGIEEIKKEFGESIAFLVDSVTKLGKIKYRGQEKNVENLRKMFLAMAEDIRVVLIKMADRLHNMQTLEFVKKEKQKRIALETLEIYAPIANRLEMGELKGDLEDLAFKYVYPQEYENLVKKSKPLYDKIRNLLTEVQPIIETELLKENIMPVSVHSRTKHLYSLYKKLENPRVGGDFDRVRDLAAIRIILNTVEECYAVLGIIHRIWKPLPGLIKDYIAIPKPNGYQSIHTTVFGPDGVIFEVQIRTVKMHEEAENGIAAHWAYSEQGKASVGGLSNQKKYAWIKQLKDWQESISDNKEFMENLKIDFFQDRIFVFTPMGEVVDLPEGATPIDFAYHVHTDVGNHCMGAKVNSKMVALDSELKNWDMVEIITTKNKKPSEGWLTFAKTSQARSKIRVALGMGKKDHL
ncbi:MAG: RelA/SpoT family protein [Patescibacteria group bacterium]|nr:RelA/SpoT family protein [Patescibacteria group bacterium]